MSQELAKAYEPKQVEERVYQMWEKSGYFNPDKLPGKKTYTITVPPPNVTGSLHMGHALNAVIQDVLIRKKRMEGYKALWLPGTDHAGIATQNAVEKDLKKQGLSRHKLGREKFLEKVWEWKEKYGNIILDQFKKLGCSLDWSRTRFTMDENYQEAVNAAFEHYHKKGWIYQGERVVNWCPRCRTSLSDLEVKYKPEKTKFYYIKYGPFTLATTRPETKLGDTGLAAHPTDKRYKDYIDKELEIDSVDNSIPQNQAPKIKKIKIKVVTDEAVDPEFGTGIIKVTPAHDITDSEIGKRHNLPAVKVIGEDGKMTEKAGIRFQGLKVKEAKEQIVKDLQEIGLLEKIEDYEHNIGVCDRCDFVIEPLPSLQWFLKMDELAKLAIKAVKKGEVKFHPKNWEKIYLNWLEKIHDWNISRQIWWGHKIPLENENDVLDTWFSSALWPFATLGWPSTRAKNGAGLVPNRDEVSGSGPEKSKDLETFYPTQVLVTDRGIINLWVARMIFSGLEFMGKKPFSDVIIHATILTKDGKRMSKSLGTGIDPMNLIEKYGADATRFGIIWQSMGNQDVRWDEAAVMAGKKFANKVWNIARFVLGQIDDLKFTTNDLKLKEKEDKEILKKLEVAKKSIEKDLGQYQFGQALHTIYDFVWHDFADKYIELSKKRTDDEAKKVLYKVVLEILKMLHPFMPHLTEEIYQNLPHKNKEFLMIEEL